MINDFIEWLYSDGKSSNTIDSYGRHIKGYLKWYDDSFNKPFSGLYRENILDYRSYLLNIKEQKAQSINPKIAAIVKFNEYLIEKKFQINIVASKKDYIKIQRECVNPATIGKPDVEAFRQKILETGSKRDYAIVTVLAYSGMRISETLSVKISAVDLTSKEILIRYGKGKKQRMVIINDKIVNAIREYKKERDTQKNKDSEYLFISQQSEKVNRTRINHIFNNYSDSITPHKLRHFFCSYALERGWTIQEVASQVGHTNITTTQLYSHPSRDEMKRKANLL